MEREYRAKMEQIESEKRYVQMFLKVAMEKNTMQRTTNDTHPLNLNTHASLLFRCLFGSLFHSR